jgi:hypothetical protein
MLTIVRRAVFPLLFVLVGLVAIIYGTAFHAVPVLEDKTREVTKVVPPKPSPFPEMDMQQFKPPTFIKVKEPYTETISVSEPEMIRDATVGGIVLTDKRELKLKYSPSSGEKPPALCPT